MAILQFGYNPTSFIVGFATLIPLMIHLGMQVFGALRLRAVSSKIGGVIKSRSDLDQVRGAIQIDLRLQIPLLFNALILLVILCSIKRWAVYLVIMTVGQVIILLTCKPIYKQFKTLPVSAENSGLAAEYNDYLKQWAGLCFRLKPPTSGQEN